MWISTETGVSTGKTNASRSAFDEQPSGGIIRALFLCPVSAAFGKSQRGNLTNKIRQLSGATNHDCTTYDCGSGTAC